MARFIVPVTYDKSSIIALTISAIYGARMDPTRAIIELAPIREFLSTVG